MADRGDGVMAYAFYGQGTRFLDVSNPKDIRQIGYYRPSQTNTWAPYWYRGLVYIADQTRGVDILRFTGDAEDPIVPEPPPPAEPLVQVPMDGKLGYLCPVRPAAVA
jgi:hypothetical protein